MLGKTNNAAFVSMSSYRATSQITCQTQGVVCIARTRSSFWNRIRNQFTHSTLFKRTIYYVVVLGLIFATITSLQAFFYHNQLDTLNIAIKKLEDDIHIYQQSSQSRKNYLRDAQRLSIDNAMTLVDNIMNTSGGNTLRVEAMGDTSTSFVFEASGTTQAIFTWLSDVRLTNRVFIGRMRLSQDSTDEPLLLYSVLHILE